MRFSTIVISAVASLSFVLAGCAADTDAQDPETQTNLLDGHEEDYAARDAKKTPFEPNARTPRPGVAIENPELGSEDVREAESSGMRPSESANADDAADEAREATIPQTFRAF
jgi:hypothetical protein